MDGHEIEEKIDTTLSLVERLHNKIDALGEKLSLVRPARQRKPSMVSGASVYPDSAECLRDVKSVLEGMAREWEEPTVENLCRKMPKKISPHTLKARLVDQGVFERDMRWTLRRLYEPFRRKHSLLLGLGGTLLFLLPDAVATGCTKLT